MVSYEQGFCQSVTRNFVRILDFLQTEGIAMEVQCRKEYVSVNVDIDQECVIHPRLIRWTNGRIFQIEQLKYKCRASSSKVSGGGIRYTAVIRGKETFLFSEGNRWFVEAKEANQ